MTKTLSIRIRTVHFEGEIFTKVGESLRIHNLPPWFDLFYVSVFIIIYECVDFM